jgi:DNA repair exonuclease SbcCD ATPase subunit
MMLTRIEVEGVGKFRSRREVIGLGPGVNILAEPNEAGKSTLFKAVRACLFQSHVADNRDVRELESDGASLPATVTLCFQHGDQSYTVRKCFLRSKSASLMQGDVEIARSKDADKRLWDLLGVGPSAKDPDDSAFGLLWVKQKGSFDPPAPGLDAMAKLNAVIEAEVGNLAGGLRGQAVLSVVTKELGELWTATGAAKAGGALKQAGSDLATAVDHLAKAEVRQRNLTDLLKQLAEKEETHRALASSEDLARLPQELDDAKARLRQGEDALQALALAMAHVERTTGEAKLWERQAKDLEDCARRVDTAREREQQLAADMADCESRLRSSEESQRSLDDQLNALDQQREAEEVKLRSLKRLLEAAEAETARALGVERLEALTDLRKRLTKNLAALATNPATSKVISACSVESSTIDELTIRLQAAAARVAINLGPSADDNVTLDGAVQTSDASCVVLAPMRIVAGQLASITITPPGGSAHDNAVKLREAKQRLAAILAEARVDDPSALRALHSERQITELEARRFEGELKAYGVDGQSIGPTIQRLEQELAIGVQDVAAALAEAGVDRLPDEKTLRADVQALERRLSEMRIERQAPASKLADQTRSHAAVIEERARLQGALAELMSKVRDDLAILPDAERDSRIAEAQSEWVKARDSASHLALEAEALRQQAPNVEQQERRAREVARLERAAKQHGESLTRLDGDIRELRGQVQLLGGEGIAQSVEELKQDVAAKQAEARRQMERAEVLKLLKDTIEQCYRERRDRLNAPLKQHLRPYLHDMFPGAELEFGERFDVESLARDGAAAESRKQLSDGTQEQIGILVRLAMGALLCERGESVPIILDDPLAFSDDYRIQRMFDAFTRAGRQHQVIILTCRTLAFARLGANQLTISG